MLRAAFRERESRRLTVAAESHWLRRIARLRLAQQLRVPDVQPQSRRRDPEGDAQRRSSAAFHGDEGRQTGGIFLKVVDAQAAPQPLTITLKDAGALAPTATAITLTTNNLIDTNSLAEPTKVVPVTSKVAGIKPTFTYTFAPYSVTVLELKAAP